MFDIFHSEINEIISFTRFCFSIVSIRDMKGTYSNNSHFNLKKQFISLSSSCILSVFLIRLKKNFCGNVLNPKNDTLGSEMHTIKNTRTKTAIVS